MVLYLRLDVYYHGFICAPVPAPVSLIFISRLEVRVSRSVCVEYRKVHGPVLPLLGFMCVVLLIFFRLEEEEAEYEEEGRSAEAMAGWRSR